MVNITKGLSNLLFILQLVLLPVLSACGTKEPEIPTVPSEIQTPTVVVLSPSTTPVSGSGVATQTLLPPTPREVIAIVPTSRGPNLEATDPATVSLASGGLQLIEFFRFT